MKTPIISRATHLFCLGVLWLAALCFAVPTARGGLSMFLELSHEVAPIYFTTNYQTLLWDFEPNTNLPAAPSGTYTVSSPTGALTEGFDVSSGGVSNYTGYANSVYSNYSSFIHELTNGNWTITVSNGTTTVYSFKISAPAFTSNTLPDLNVTYPLLGSTITSNNPTFTWQGIAWGSGNIKVQDYSGANFFEENFLATSATSWMSPSNLPAGQNTFLLTYASPILTNITATTPTNGLSQPIGGWNFSAFIVTYAVDGFTVSNAVSPPPTLAQALNTTNVTWTSGGNSNWFGETNISHDGVSAAQSGGITDSQATWVQTTAPSSGQVSFYWKVSSEENHDYLRFFINGAQQDAISGEVNWTQKTYSVPAGATLRWQYDKDGSGLDGADAAWLDQVQFSTNIVSNAPVSVSIGVNIERYNDQINGSEYYYSYADINFVDPSPVTTNRLESADGMIYSEVFAGDDSEDTSGSEFAATLDDAIHACTNGQWKLYINKGAPNQQVFYFNLSVNSLTTNFLGSVQMLAPAPNAVNVASNSPIQWSGPTNASSIFGEAYQQSPSFAFDGYTNLPATATSWPSPPSLLTGTNYCFIQYSYYNFTNFSFTTPVDASLTPVADWNPAFYLYSVASSMFSVRSPLAVQITGTPPPPSGGNFQLSFQTVPGHTEIVQMRTNLFSGAWVDVTNFVGNGSGYQLAVPITNSPGKYFRVITQ